MPQQNTSAPQPTQPQVEFRGIAEFPGYRVGSDGSVWSCWQRRGVRGAGRRGTKGELGDVWRRMALCRHPGGYSLVRLSRGAGDKATMRVHRLVLEAFVGPCPEGMQCCHRDGNPTNNSLDNLRWDTPKSNQDDVTRHGRRMWGENHTHAKLSREDVTSIRRRYQAGGETYASLAAEFGVRPNSIGRIVRGLRWKYLSE